jgi:hypothetical protein
MIAATADAMKVVMQMTVDKESGLRGLFKVVFETYRRYPRVTKVRA